MSDVHAMTVQQQVAYLDAVAHKLPADQARFAASLITFYGNKGYLTERQEPHVKKLILAAEPELRDQTNDIQISNFQRIIEVFDTAQESGRENPKLRLGDKEHKVELTIGKPGSANPGLVYIKYNGDYLGKVLRDGKLIPNNPCVPVHILALLEQFSIDPQKMMRDYGFKTGKCCVCGRTLTDPVSRANGIGPICAEGW